MPPDEIPSSVTALAEARAAARRARDWGTADELRGQIEAAGWRVVDSGTMYDLERATPPDVVDNGIVLHGSSASVPSRLQDPPVGVASVVIVATDWPDDVARTVRALGAYSPAGTQLVVVANGPSPDQEEALAALRTAAGPESDLEVVRLAARLGWAAAINAGIRRAAGPVVVLLDTSVEPEADVVSAMVVALDDPTVAVTGPFGLVSGDLRRFETASAGITEVDAIEGYAQAFRRSDYAARGPLDEHFVFFRNLDVWWSLVLRDQDADASEGAPPRRAVRIEGVPTVRHIHRGWTSLPDDERERQSRRNFYRVLKQFATRRDLLAGAAG